MSQGSEQDSDVLAKALLDIVPRVFQRVRADVPLYTKTCAADQDIRDVSELSITSGQLALLQILVEHERCMMQELAEHLTVAPSTTTAMVKRLVAQGYVERSRDDVDWRSVWVKPTERGRRVFTVYNDARRVSLKSRPGQLSEEERHHLAAALPALLHLIEV